jgi:hypothetical protein
VDPIGKHLAGVGSTPAPPPLSEDRSIRMVFRVLHGYYGALFLSKYGTGNVLQDGQHRGEDEGIVNARRVWAHNLRRYLTTACMACEREPAECQCQRGAHTGGMVLMSALERCKVRHPEFPPSMPQFAALVEAAAPVRAWRPAEPAQPALEMDPALREQRRAEARQAATEAARRPLREREPEGLDLLKSAIAGAVRDAGGDDAATLLALDRMLSCQH